MIEQKTIKSSLLKKNTGQIHGLPKNPRVIKDSSYQLLVKSIKEDPEMLELREVIVYPFEGKYVIIAGNMRFTAMLELGYKEIPCKILDESTSTEKLKAITIKDNTTFGTFDFDELANNWDSEELNDWGVNVWVPEEESESYEDKNKELDMNDLDGKCFFKLEYSQDDYELLKSRLSAKGKTPEAVFYDALV